jgi:hypothetical protein
MRKLFFLVIGILTYVNTSFADDCLLIRRAYLDVLGVVPTISEIEWYCVYNNNGYELAIEWLISHKNYNLDIPKEQAKKYLLSNEYRNLKKRKLTELELNKILLYVTGYKHLPVNTENIKLASRELVINALNSDVYSSMDYLANNLMCRSLTLKEENDMNKILKEAKKTNNEIDSWLIVLANILQLEDTITK